MRCLGERGDRPRCPSRRPGLLGGCHDVDRGATEDKAVAVMETLNPGGQVACLCDLVWR
jgi:hypothetical protein